MNEELLARKSRKLVIIGATGFIGRALLKLLNARKGLNVLALVRNEVNDELTRLENIVYVKVKFSDVSEISKHISPGCVVINLMYDNENLSENCRIIDMIATASVTGLALRCIHMSTAVVAGRVSDKIITERTIDKPFTKYEKAKLEIENRLANAFAQSKVGLVIIRPTAVFGAGGQNLLKFIYDVENDSAFISYLRACFHDKRPMNLVSVEKVIGAIEFFIDSSNSGCEKFIVSDDNESLQNFSELERLVRIRLGKSDRFVPVIPVPSFIVSIFLRVRGRSNLNIARRYSDEKLMSFGFDNANYNFNASLEKFIDLLVSKNF